MRVSKIWEDKYYCLKEENNEGKNNFATIREDYVDFETWLECSSENLFIYI